MSKSLEEGGRREEYILELLSSEGNSKRVIFFGDACTIGTGSKVDVLLNHTEELKCIIDYKSDKLQVLEGRVKINGEIITEELKIHYPCIIEIAEQLFRITKVQKNTKEPETKKEAQLKAVKQYMEKITDGGEEDIFHSEENSSQESSEMFSNEEKDPLLVINMDEMNKGDIKWNMKSIPDETLQMITDLCDFADNLSETEKELEPEMHSDDIKQKQEEEKNKERNDKITKEEPQEKDKPIVDGHKDSIIEDKEGSFNISRISIFESIPYLEEKPSTEAPAEQQSLNHPEEISKTDEHTKQITQIEQDTTIEETKIIEQIKLAEGLEQDKTINQIELNEGTEETKIIEQSEITSSIKQDSTVEPAEETEKTEQEQEKIVDQSKAIEQEKEQEVPLQKIKSTELPEEEPKTPLIPSTPGKSIRRASISHQIITRQKTDKKKKKAPADKKRKKQKKKE